MNWRRLVIPLLIIGVMFKIATWATCTAGAQNIENSDAQLDAFITFSIESFGWECDKVKKIEAGSFSHKAGRSSVFKIICTPHAVYYYKILGGTSPTQICHKGTCRIN